jgi:hypothetical protein
MALPQQNDPATVQQPSHLLFHYSPHHPPPPPSTGYQDGLQVLHGPGGPPPENGYSFSPEVHYESSIYQSAMAGGLNYPYNIEPAPLHIEPATLNVEPVQLNVAPSRKSRASLTKAVQVGLRSVLLSCQNLTSCFPGLQILPDFEGEMRRE